MAQTPSPETQVRASAIVDELLALTPTTDPRYQYLLLLKHQVEVDERQFTEAGDYARRNMRKPTRSSPRQRARSGCTSGRWKARRRSFVAVGDGEYLGNVDPKLETPAVAGDRVVVNDAFAVVKVLPPAEAGPVVKIGEVLEGGRLRLGGDTPGVGSRIVERAASLKESELKVGDEVRLEPTGKLAVEHFPKSESRDFFLEEVPVLPWDKVGGQDEVIEIIRDAIELPSAPPGALCQVRQAPAQGNPALRPSRLRQDPDRKSNRLQPHPRVQREHRREPQRVLHVHQRPEDPQHVARRVGAAVCARSSRRPARRPKKDTSSSCSSTKPSRFFALEIRGRWTNISNTVVPQFCAEMDGLVSSKNVVVMLTSNRPDYIDPAILRPERIDRRVRVKRPDRKAAKDILGIYLNEELPLAASELEKHGGDKKATASALVDETVTFLWRKTAETEFLDVFNRNGGSERLYWKDLVSGALLSSLVERAKDFAIKRAIATKNFDTEGVTQEDLQKAVAMEFKENEIFPKSDAVEDWLMLLDQSPENVADVKPIRSDTRGKGTAKAPSGVI